jgi:membrane protease YdiL (CAAX protease family)
LLGLLFGAARLRTGSVVVPMVMHAASNVIAMVEAAIKVG